MRKGKEVENIIVAVVECTARTHFPTQQRSGRSRPRKCMQAACGYLRSSSLRYTVAVSPYSFPPSTVLRVATASDLPSSMSVEASLCAYNIVLSSKQTCSAGKVIRERNFFWILKWLKKTCILCSRQLTSNMYMTPHKERAPAAHTAA